MKTTWVGRLLLALVLATATCTAAPNRTARKPPAHHTDARCQHQLPDGAETVRTTKLAEVLRKATDANFLLPGAPMGETLTLDQKRRRVRDLMDSIAERMQGEWKKVSGAYVLVLQPDRLESAELTSRARERATKDCLDRLAATLEEEQLAALLNGRPLTQVTASLEQRAILRELGTLGYYAWPQRRDPKSLSGHGVAVSASSPDGSVELQVWLPIRSGRPAMWFKHQPARRKGDAALPP